MHRKRAVPQAPESSLCLLSMPYTCYCSSCLGKREWATTRTLGVHIERDLARLPIVEHPTIKQNLEDGIHKTQASINSKTLFDPTPQAPEMQTSVVETQIQGMKLGISPNLTIMDT